MFVKIFLSIVIFLFSVIGELATMQIMNEPSTFIVLFGIVILVALPLTMVYTIGKLWGYFRKEKKEGKK